MGLETFRCSICDVVGKWKNVDEYRYKPHGMSLCQNCGFVTYPEIQQNIKDLTEFYREEYREAPSVNNIFSGERKLHYHDAFLASLFGEWKTEGIKSPEVLEIGSAFGMFLQWFKAVIPGAILHGTELTLSFRRNAWWMYGIRLDETPDWSKKYDLICSYKVAEHIPNIDKEIRQYAESLTPTGRLYISVPTWFGTMCNFGLSGFGLEYYYHKNHINVWSKNLFETLLKKCGLRVVKYNATFYDDTYLCVRDDKLMDEKRVYDDPVKRLGDLDNINKAARAYDVGEFGEAIKLWPDFPDAHINNYERQRGKLHKEGFNTVYKQFLDPAMKACQTSTALFAFVADLHMRYEEFNTALKFLEQCLEMKPNDPQSLVALHHVYRQMSLKANNPDDALRLLMEGKEATKHLQRTSKQLCYEAITWQMQDNSKIPMPFEKESAANGDTNKTASSR